MVIDDEIAEIWTRTLQELLPQASPPSSYVADFDQQQPELEAQAQKDLQPWLRIVEEGITWLGLFESTVNQLNQESRDKTTVSLWVVVSLVCSQSLAIRRLVLSGIDAPAQIVLRSLSESVQLCALMLVDVEVRSRFHEAGESDMANEFWNTYIARGKLGRRLSVLEPHLGVPPEVAESFRLWRDQESRYLSEFTHPSFRSALHSTYAYVSIEPARLQRATFGCRNLLSIRTLDHAMKAIWYLSQFAGKAMLRTGEPDVVCCFPLNRTAQDRHSPVGAILVIALREVANNGANTRFAPTKDIVQCPNVMHSGLDPLDSQQMSSMIGAMVYGELVNKYWDSCDEFLDRILIEGDT